MSDDGLRSRLGLDSSATRDQVASKALEELRELRRRAFEATTTAQREEIESQANELEQLFLTWGARAPGSWSTTPDLPPGTGPALLAVGARLGRRYEIRRRLGAGGMGEVYAAFDHQLQREVALKTIRPDFLHPEARARFLREAAISTALSHPNIVNCFDVGESSGLLFLTMELLVGRTLRQELLEEGPLALDRALGITRALCDALEHAHHRTVHRDIKPANVFLCDDGTVKLLDFGIARLVSTSHFTMVSAAIGTAGYMAPEQLREGGQIDARADQYALGVVLYEMLTGKLPTGRAKAATDLREDVPVALSRVIDRALAESPTERFTDIGALRSALEQAWSGGRRRRGRGGVAAGRHRRGWRAWEFALVAVAALGGGLAVALSGSDSDGRRPERPDWDGARAALVQELAEAGRLATALGRDEPVPVAAAREALARADARADQGDATEAFRIVEPVAEPVRAARRELEQDQQREVAAAAATEARLRSAVESWAEVVRIEPDPAIVEGVEARQAIVQAALPWLVRDRRSGIEMALIPPGSYRRGASPGDLGADDDERPTHDVEIASPFYLGRTEVTNGQYRRWRADHDSGASSRVDGTLDRLDGDPQPAVRLTWDDAAAFCEAHGLRLPTEVEWEYAARAGATTRFPWGDSVAELRTRANTYGDGDGHLVSAPVGSFPPNGFGLYDMIGNVWEWCASGYDSQEYARYAGGARPDVMTDPAPGAPRVLRGGSWYLDESYCRVSFRYRRAPTASNEGSGFRVARSPQ
ncbi:MAG: SUMF1/EgtB/PvdO family nonheme iron enzyme [Planctomycetes bacterium]|nr:SUMF1/EgtB/PvdO family nonheme iron enzyme [Planctomycetota bacterium]